MEEWAVGAVFLFTLVLVLGFGYLNNKADNDAVVNLVQSGVPPIEAMCAIRPPSKDNCLLYATKKE